MRRLYVLPLLASLVAGCMADGPETCKMAHVTDLALSYDEHSLATPAVLNDQPATMVIDSGSDMTLINRTVAERLHLALESTDQRVNGIGGSQALYFFHAHSFRIGDLHGKGLLLESSNIGATTSGHQIDGLFGADFLSVYEVDFDLHDKRVRLYKVLAGCAKPSANLSDPLFYAPMERSLNTRDKRAHVRVLIDGIGLDAVVDSGAVSTVIFRNSARRLGLRLADLTADRHGRALGIGPRTRDEVRHIMAPMQIGEITISNLPVAIIDQASSGDADMLLGLDFLARVHVWLSFTSNTVIMQYPPAPSPNVQGE